MHYPPKAEVSDTLAQGSPKLKFLLYVFEEIDTPKRQW